MTNRRSYDIVYLYKTNKSKGCDPHAATFYDRHVRFASCNAGALSTLAERLTFFPASPTLSQKSKGENCMKTTIFRKKTLLWVMILCILLCAVSSCASQETTSQEQSTESVPKTSEESQLQENTPAEMPDYAEFIPLRMQYLTMESEPELFYASRGEESWLYIPAWEQTVHLPSYILDERSSGALVEDEAIFVGTNANNGEPYALYAKKGIKHIEKKKIEITAEAKSFTTFCDNTDTYSKFSVFVFATTEDEVIPYHCSIQNFTEHWAVTYLPFLPTIPAGLTPVMADYVGAYYSGYIAFQPTTGNTGYFELYSSDHNSDGSRLVKWNHHATIVCPSYEGLVSARPISLKRISRNSTKLAMTVRVDLENDEPQYVTFQGENSRWSMDPVENNVSYSFEIPAEKKTTAVSVDKFDLDPKSWLSLKPTSGYALPEYAILGLNGEVYRDQSNAFYLYDSQNLYCINTGETLPVELPYDVFDIAFGSDRLYCLRANGSIMIFDTSRGLGSSTLLEETKPRADFVYRNLYVYQDELLVYDDDLSPVCNIDGEARQLPYALTSIASKNMFVYKADGRYLLYNQGAKEPYRYCASDDNGITLALPGTGVLYSDTTRWWENPYLRFDKDGNVLSRVIVKRESTLLRTPCQIPFYTSEGVQHTVLKHKFYTLSINEFTMENLIDHRLFWNKDGTCYLLAVTAEHMEIYLVTPGVTHAELTARTAENSTRKEFETIFTWYSLTDREVAEMLEASVDFVPGRGIKITEADEPVIYTSPIFHLRDEFIAYFTDYSRLEARLSTYGINCKVKDAILVVSDLFSPVIRIVTTENTLFFLAVKDTGRTYEFTVFTEEEFTKACLQFPATVYVNGEELETHLMPVIYGDYADIPFIALMESLGADIQWPYDDFAAITLGGNTCNVDTYESSLVFEDVPYSTVTEAFDRDNGDEILIRSDVLRLFLDKFYPGVEICIDPETDAVYITS